jgi:hypothetical protein
LSFLFAEGDLVERFHCMLRARTPEALPAWITDTAGGMLASFGHGIANDAAAVKAALTEPWSNGATEGGVARLKLVRRQMYGPRETRSAARQVDRPSMNSHQHENCDRAPIRRRSGVPFGLCRSLRAERR